MSEESSSKRSAPLKARPEIACHRLAGALARRLEEQGGRWRCSALPQMDGSILFSVSGLSGHLTLTWSAGGGIVLPDIPGGFSIEQLDRSGLDRTVLQAMEVILADLLAGEFSHCSPLGSGEMAGTLIELQERLQDGWLQSKLAGWFAYGVESLQMKAEHIDLAYSDGERRIVFSIGQVGRVGGDTDSSPMNVPGLRLHLTEDDRTSEEYGKPQHQVERSLAFALARIPFSLESKKGRASDGELGRSGGDQCDRGQDREQVSLSDLIRKGGRQENNIFLLPEEKRWRQFMADTDLEHFFHAGWETSSRIAFVQHSDRGCFFMRPYLHAPLTRFINYPKPLGMSSGFQVCSTMLSDRDVISDGSESRLDELLDGIAEEGDAPDTVILDDTCIPKLLGQDLEGVKKRFSGKHDIPILQCFPGASFSGHGEGINQLFQELLIEQSPKNTQVSDSSPGINLVGFNLARDLDEICNLLKSIGIRINASLLPNIDAEQARRFSQAQLQVLRPSAFLEDIYRKSFIPTGVPEIMPPAPFGLDASRRWFAEITERLDLGPVWDDYLLARPSGIEAQLVDWKSKTTDLSLGFVVDCGQISRIWDHRRNFGLSPLEVLQEFGFGCTAYVYEDSRKDATRAEIGDVLSDLLSDSGFGEAALELKFFSTEEELTKLLGNGGARLIFSDYFDDPRITSAGKAWFSLADFEMGFEGARRSFERLHRRCRLDYYSRLKRAMDGEA